MTKSIAKVFVMSVPGRFSAEGYLSGKYNAADSSPKEYLLSSYPMEDIEPIPSVLRKLCTSRIKPDSAVALDYEFQLGCLTAC